MNSHPKFLGMLPSWVGSLVLGLVVGAVVQPALSYACDCDAVGWLVTKLEVAGQDTPHAWALDGILEPIDDRLELRLYGTSEGEIRSVRLVKVE